MGDVIILIGGYAWHEDKVNIANEEYESFIPSIGIQYKYNYKNLNCYTTAIVIDDSNANAMPSVTFGIGKNVLSNLELGVDVGVSSRVVYVNYGSGNDMILSTSRQIVPIILPRAIVSIDMININIGYIPPINGSSIKVTQAIYVNFGIKL